MRDLALDEVTMEGVPHLNFENAVSKEVTGSTAADQSNCHPLSGSADLSSTSGGSKSPRTGSERDSTELGRTDMEDVSSTSAGSENIGEFVESTNTAEERRRTLDNALPHDPLRCRIRSISPMRISAPLRDAAGKPLDRPRGRLESQASAPAFQIRTSVSPMQPRQQLTSPSMALAPGCGVQSITSHQYPSPVRPATCRVVSPVDLKRAPSPVGTCVWRQRSSSPLRTFLGVPLFSVAPVFGQRSSPLRTRPHVTAYVASRPVSTKEYAFPLKVNNVVEKSEDRRSVARDEANGLALQENEHTKREWQASNTSLTAGTSEIRKRDSRKVLAQALPEDISRSRIRSTSPMRIVAPLRDEEGKPLHRPRGRLEASPPRSKQTGASPARTCCRAPAPPAAVRMMSSYVSPPRSRCASPTRAVSPTRAWVMPANKATLPVSSAAVAISFMMPSSPHRQRPQVASVNAMAPTSSRFLLGPTVTPQRQPLPRTASYCIPSASPSPFAKDLVPQTWFGF